MTPRAALADPLTTAAFSAAWAGVRALPEGPAYRLFETMADATFKRNGPGVQRMRANYALVRRELSDGDLEELTRAGVRSYLRYWCDAFRLPALKREDLRELVTTSGAIDEVRRRLADGESIVLYLGHMGNWDLAGAWSATELAHVTTVAERLKPEKLFTKFLTFRESLGMTIIPLDRGVDVLGAVERRLREPGAFAPLLADRDLTSRGARVNFAGEPARVAVGPAVLAQRTGAALYPVSITYRPPHGRPMRGINIHFHDAVTVPDTGEPRADIVTATQSCVDALAAAVVAHTEDWHMMQKVFVRDLGARRPGVS